MLRTAAWLTVAALFAIGLHRASLAVLARVAPEHWLRTTPHLSAWIWSIYAVVAAFGVIYAIVRARRSRIRPTTLAHRLDRELATDDVLSTALALEEGRIEAPRDLEAIVRARAYASSADLDCPVPRFTLPRRPLAAVGFAAAGIALLPAPIDAHADITTSSEHAAAAETSTEVVDPELSEESVERLARAAEALAELERRPALAGSTLEQLAAAREQLEAVARDQSRSLSKLSRVDQTIRELQRRDQERRLHDPARLRSLSHERLTRALADSLDAGHHDATGPLAEELARRLRDADERALESLSRSLQRALEEPTSTERAPAGRAAPAARPQRDEGSGSESDAASREGDARTRWRDAARELPDRLEAGDREAVRQALRRMADEVAHADGERTATSVLERSLEDVRRARAEQIARMNDGGDTSPSGPADRDAPNGSGATDDRRMSRAAVPSSAVPLGMPGGRPGPGGGDGRERGEASKRRIGPPPPAERVEAHVDGASHGSVAVIQRFMQGARDDREYEELHHHYESVAESAVRRERIPLTRRDYIRSYFQAVRPD